MPVPAMPLERLGVLLDTHARPRPVPLAPDVVAWWADDELPLWMALEEELARPIGPPFFCVPWPGAQALALAVDRRLIDVEGRTVLDVGCGSGVAAIACAKRGARVVASDVDWLACASALVLAARNDVSSLRALCMDALSTPELGERCGVVLAGDVVYSRDQGALLERAVERWLEAGVDVVLADSGRPFFTSCGLPCLLEQEVAVPRSLDGAERRVVRVFASASVARV